VNGTCIDPKIGAYLHAYELGALPEDMSQAFEVHLLRCQHCFQELTAASSYTNLLRGDDETRRSIRSLLADTDLSAGGWTGVWRRLWPETPLVFRPLVPYLLALAIAAVAVISTLPGKSAVDKQTIRQVQAVALFPTRGASAGTFTASMGRDGVISLVYPDAGTDGRYHVTITRGDDAAPIFADAAFSFDRYKTGWISFPASAMQSGTYTVHISDLRSTAPAEERHYEFIVE